MDRAPDQDSTAKSPDKAFLTVTSIFILGVRGTLLDEVQLYTLSKWRAPPRANIFGTPTVDCDSIFQMSTPLILVEADGQNVVDALMSFALTADDSCSRLDQIERSIPWVANPHRLAVVTCCCCNVLH